MKQLTSYNRVAGYLNKLFDLLNQRFFENELLQRADDSCILRFNKNYNQFFLSEQRKTGGLSLYPQDAANDSERKIGLIYLSAEQIRYLASLWLSFVKCKENEL